MAESEVPDELPPLPAASAPATALAPAAPLPPVAPVPAAAPPSPPPVQAAPQVAPPAPLPATPSPPPVTPSPPPVQVAPQTPPPTPVPATPSPPPVQAVPQAILSPRNAVEAVLQQKPVEFPTYVDQKLFLSKIIADFQKDRIDTGVKGDIISSLEKTWNEDRIKGRISAMQEEIKGKLHPLIELEQRWRILKTEIEDKSLELREVEQKLRQGTQDIETLIYRRNQLTQLVGKF
jgi:hypothetical protein